MFDWSDVFRTAAIVVLIAVFVATLAAVIRHASTPVVEASPTVATPASDDLSAELRRCGALGPQDAEDPHCRAVWGESRRRFFGRPARPLQLPAAPVTAPTAQASGGAL